jgi:hypothetical protein
MDASSCCYIITNWRGIPTGVEFAMEDASATARRRDNQSSVIWSSVITAFDSTETERWTETTCISRENAQFWSIDQYHTYEAYTHRAWIAWAGDGSYYHTYQAAGEFKNRPWAAECVVRIVSLRCVEWHALTKS